MTPERSGFEPAHCSWSASCSSTAATSEVGAGASVGTLFELLTMHAEAKQGGGLPLHERIGGFGLTVLGRSLPISCPGQPTQVLDRLQIAWE